MHDPRIGRFFAVDPLTSKFSMIGSYQFSSNRVIDGLELEGLETYLPYGNKWGYNSGYTVGGMSQNVGVFVGNVGVGIWNGIAGGWNFLGDADKVYYDEGGGIDGLVKSGKHIANGVGDGLEHTKDEIEWFVQDPGDYIEHTTVDDVENIVGGLIGAKGINKLSNKKTVNQQLSAKKNYALGTEVNVNHTFSGKPGKFDDTPSNRMLVENIANGDNTFHRVDEYGKDWFYKNNSDGSQSFVYGRDGTVKGAGINKGSDVRSPDHFDSNGKLKDEHRKNPIRKK